MVATPSLIFMTTSLLLEELPDEVLDAVLSLEPSVRATYFEKMVINYYPHVVAKSAEFTTLVETYNSSFYLEKMYRTNRFFNERFTPVYTHTGLIRNVIADIFFADDDLITH